MGTCFSSSSRRHRDLVNVLVNGSYMDEFQLREALIYSSIASRVEINHHPHQVHDDSDDYPHQVHDDSDDHPYQVHYDSDDDDSDDYPHQLHDDSDDSATLINQEEPENQTEKKSAAVISHEESEIKTDNEPADPSKRFCIICMDEVPISEIFKGTTNCTHSYCTECTIRYVETKIQENASRIKCPDVECTRLIEPYTCRDLIPKDVYERWDKILCESLIITWDKHYCPFEGCSAMMVVDDEDDDDASVTQTECPSCHRLFCAQCQVAWHAGIECEEFQRFGNTKKKSSEEEDAMLIQMAKRKQWRKCPNCKYYVERSMGCKHIICRCGYEFCYGCGSAWTSYVHTCHITPAIRSWISMRIF